MNIFDKLTRLHKFRNWPSIPNTQLNLSKSHLHNCYNQKQHCRISKEIRTVYNHQHQHSIYQCSSCMYIPLQLQNYIGRNLKDKLRKYLNSKNRLIGIEYKYFDQHILSNQKDMLCSSHLGLISHPRNMLSILNFNCKHHNGQGTTSIVHFKLKVHILI